MRLSRKHLLLPFISIVSALALGLGCEQDNSDSETGGSTASNSSDSASDITGSWTGGGVTITLSDGPTPYGGSATIQTPLGSHKGTWGLVNNVLTVVSTDDLYGPMANGVVNGNTWNAYFTDVPPGTAGNITFTRQ